MWDNAVGIPNRLGAGIPTVDEKILKKNPGDEAFRLTQSGGGFGEVGSGFDRTMIAADKLDLGSDPEVKALLVELNKKMDEQNRLLAGQQPAGPREKRGQAE